jgi:hypothetical protein
MAFPILGTPKPQFFDSSGSPLSSGTLSVLNPADDTNKASYPTYDDAEAATNANVNPVVLDARGEPPNGLWGLDSEDYKLVLKDSAGTTIWTADDITMGGNTQAGIGKILYPQTSNESTAGVTPTNYEYEPADIRRYGAVVDGSTDDYTAVNNALTAYNTVYFPEGTTVVGTTITLSENQNIVGEGWRQSEIKADTGLTTSLVIIDDRCMIKDVLLSGTGSKATSNGVKTADTAARWRLSSVTISNFVNGLNLQACWIATIDHLECRSCTDGIYVNNVDNYDDPVNAINIIGGEIAACSQSAIHFEQGAGGAFSVNNFNIYGMAIEPSGTYGAWNEDVAINSIKFDGCYFEACGAACWKQDASVGTIAFNSCLLNVFTTATDKAIDVTAGTTDAFIVTACEFDRAAGSSATEGVDFGASAVVKNAIFIGNVWDASLSLVNDMASGNHVFSIGDETHGTKFPGVDSISGGTDPNSAQWMGKETFGSADTTKAVTIATEADATYRVNVFGFDWDYGTYWITSQTTSGFTININTARGSGSREVYWQLYRR